VQYTPLRVKAFVNRYTLQGKIHGAHNAMAAHPSVAQCSLPK